MTIRIATAVLALLALTNFAGCGDDGVLAANDDLNKSYSKREGPISINNTAATPLHFGIANYIFICDDSPMAYGTFEVADGASLGIRVIGREQSGLKLNLYRLGSNGAPLHLRAIGSSLGTASLNLRSISGGYYAIGVATEEQRAAVVVELTCDGDRTCWVRGQPGHNCGGVARSPCDDGLYCALADNACGRDAVRGTCEMTPSACIEVFAPVCGCNGTTYPNRCQAEMAGQNIATEGPC